MLSLPISAVNQEASSRVQSKRLTVTDKGTKKLKTFKLPHPALECDVCSNVSVHKLGGRNSITYLPLFAHCFQATSVAETASG